MKMRRLPFILMILVAAIAFLTVSIALAQKGVSPGSPGEAELTLSRMRRAKVAAANSTIGETHIPGLMDRTPSTGSASLDIQQVAAAFPVCTGFEEGTLPDYFRAETSSNGPANGRVAVTTFFPHNGTYALDFDTDCNRCGGSTTQAAIMAVDLAGQSNVDLNFWVH